MALYMLFSTYGPVLDVVVMRTAKLRGQAHVVFRDTQASTQAMRALHGFDFFGKDLVCYVAITHAFDWAKHHILEHRLRQRPFRCFHQTRGSVSAA